MTHNHYDNSSV